MSTHDDFSSNIKEQISESFLKLIKTQPIDRITVKMIADKCGISRQSFYYYYSDVFAVIEFLFFGMLDQAKKERNFALADEIRAKLTAMKIDIMDTPNGTIWEKSAQ